MREIFMVLPLFLAISTAPMCFGQGKTPSHTLTINVVKGAVKTGTKIRLTIALRNTSTHEITVHMQDPVLAEWFPSLLPWPRGRHNENCYHSYLSDSGSPEHVWC